MIKVPANSDEMKAIIEEWAKTKPCDDGDEMRYFSGEVLSIIEFMNKEDNQ